jgi:putative ATP-binding cassette transporter
MSSHPNESILMPSARETGLRQSFVAAWRLACPYFRSQERIAANLFLLAVILLRLVLVGTDVGLNLWRNAFFDATQKRDWDVFILQFWVFGAITLLYIFATVYQQYLTQGLTIRWRRHLTQNFVARWLDAPSSQISPIADNPDQRVAEDAREFVILTLTLGIGFLGSLASLASFIVILWNLSRAIPLTLFGVAYEIPGYLVWAAMIYSLMGTIVAHVLGRRLIALDFEQQKREADFRYALVKLRDGARPLDGNHTEAAKQLNRQFDAIALNWQQQMDRQKVLGFFTAGYRQFSLVFPYIVVGPLYFFGAMPLGAFMQTGSAFALVREGFSYFITAYKSFAEWVAVVQRLEGFDKILPLDKIGADSDDRPGSAGDCPAE